MVAVGRRTSLHGPYVRASLVRCAVTRLKKCSTDRLFCGRLRYLTDGYGGGGTWFPRGGPNATALSIGGDDTAALNEEMRAIMREATRVAVQPGDAVLFCKSNRFDGRLHAGLSCSF